jgi:hypothetical protein
MLEALSADPATPSAAPEFRRMEPFIGTWLLEGEQYATDLGAAAKVEALETFEWLTGGHFVVHRFEGRVGEDPAACIEVIGYDEARAEYPVRTFYNDGRKSEWILRETGDSWTLSGEWATPSGSMRVRCAIGFEDGERTRTGVWQYEKDGDWVTFWDVRATRSS